MAEKLDVGEAARQLYHYRNVTHLSEKQAREMAKPFMNWRWSAINKVSGGIDATMPAAIRTPKSGWAPKLAEFRTPT